MRNKSPLWSEVIWATGVMVVLFGGLFGIPLGARLLGLSPFVGVSVSTFVVVCPLSYLIASRGNARRIRDRKQRLVGTSIIAVLGVSWVVVAAFWLNRWVVLAAVATTSVFISYVVAAWRSSA